MNLSPDFAGRLARAIGRELRLARLNRGWTQQDVAEALGSHRPCIARTEAGRHLPELPRLVVHAAHVGVGLDELGRVVDAVLAGERAGAVLDARTKEAST